MLNKNKTLLKRLTALIICALLGMISAEYAKSNFTYEEFRMSESSVSECPEDYSEVQCRITPAYNPKASGGFEGYPIVSGRYYCTEDSNCISVTQSQLTSNISLQRINEVIFSLFYFLLFLSFLWLRKRVRRNRIKSENPVP
jgi:hypothetical protein